MAFGARSAVENWPESSAYVVNLLVDLLIVGIGVPRRFHETIIRTFGIRDFVPVSECRSCGCFRCNRGYLVSPITATPSNNTKTEINLRVIISASRKIESSRHVQCRQERITPANCQTANRHAIFPIELLKVCESGGGGVGRVFVGAPRLYVPMKTIWVLTGLRQKDPRPGTSLRPRSNNGPVATPWNEVTKSDELRSGGPLRPVPRRFPGSAGMLSFWNGLLLSKSDRKDLFFLLRSRAPRQRLMPSAGAAQPLPVRRRVQRRQAFNQPVCCA